MLLAGEAIALQRGWAIATDYRNGRAATGNAIAFCIYLFLPNPTHIGASFRSTSRCW
ncbi:hypothetical protein [Limnofasciculus baicalensis]|uniref:Uncharacterized protein n=1 Tax=Limnofasciculus baicalensis BBK-W-15 TaxID=2699891 RepID=A0AAE3KRA3_9CYAN|nr:hypothetical protein [Limnofasciculus baicalensis]MCP2732646.1 hypothetical protein [Limnofasciculus baicalensis BBK-W-15]